MKPVVFTSTLPADTWQVLEAYARKFNVPRNKILEQALQAYFGRLKQAEYIKSFKKASGDSELESMAEEGLDDYLKILDEL